MIDLAAERARIGAFVALDAGLIIRAWRSMVAWRDGWAARCDRVALTRLRERSRSGDMAHDFEVIDAPRLRQEEAERARLAEVMRDLRATHATGDVLGRASAYLAEMGTDAKGLFNAALYMTRAFALDEDTATSLIEREYVPRYHRKVPLGELRATVRRAAKSNRVGLGWLLRDRPLTAR